jgi:alkanesulfonate monooxygenase SsuD/methylene tetrahydromethanopterin reductase-like flavin-dependent oxidoreductase (luciferase family)
VPTGEEGHVRFAIGLPNVGPFGDPVLLVELAVAAERAGWDGVFLWDHLLHHDPTWPVADPTVTISAVAAVTDSVRLAILMVALPRRRPWKVAKEFATLDRLSGGRMILGAGLGSMDREYAAFGEDPSLRERARRLDDGLKIIDACWTGGPVEVRGAVHRVEGVELHPRPLQRPRIPIWVAGRWPNRAPFTRAARWDGLMPIHSDYGRGRTMPPELVADIRAHVAAMRLGDEPFDLALEGATGEGADDEARLGAYAAAGVTWWVEAMGWWRGGPEAARDRIAAGPPDPDPRQPGADPA